jgi:hypothetical protein
MAVLPKPLNRGRSCQRATYCHVRKKRCDLSAIQPIDITYLRSSWTNTVFREGDTRYCPPSDLNIPNLARLGWFSRLQSAGRRGVSGPSVIKRETTPAVAIRQAKPSSPRSLVRTQGNMLIHGTSAFPTSSGQPRWPIVHICCYVLEREASGFFRYHGSIGKSMPSLFLRKWMCITHSGERFSVTHPSMLHKSLA